MVILDKIKDVIKPAFNTRAAGIYMLLFAVTIGVATLLKTILEQVPLKKWFLKPGGLSCF